MQLLGRKNGGGGGVGNYKREVKNRQTHKKCLNFSLRGPVPEKKMKKKKGRKNKKKKGGGGGQGDYNTYLQMKI